MSKTIKAIVCCAGDMARKHIEAYRKLDNLEIVAVASGSIPRAVALSAAYDTAKDRFTDAWLGHRQTPPTDTFVRWIWKELSVSVPDGDHERTVSCFRDVLLVLGEYPGPPEPPGGDCSGISVSAAAGCEVFGSAAGCLSFFVRARTEQLKVG